MTGSTTEGAQRQASRDALVRQVAKLVHELVTFPLTVLALLGNRRIHPAYGMTAGRRLALAWRMYRNSFRIVSATTWKAHLAMASKILEMDPELEGVVVECGCFKGGSAANLSLVCDIVGRELILYDSFEGMPVPARGDRYGSVEAAGSFRGTLDVVQRNIRRGGAIDRCTFRKGWFSDTLPEHREPIVLAFWDVDYQDSLRTCLLELWPHLVWGGFVFIDEYILVDYCAVFFSERFWREHFDTVPPGLHGTGTGIPLGQYFVGPYLTAPPLQNPASVAFTQKGGTGYWDYYPEDLSPPPAEGE